MKKNGNLNIKNIVSTTVSQVINPLIRLNSKIKERRGVLKVTSLIPCPLDQAHQVNKHSEGLQQVLSEVYVTVNEEIDTFNREKTHTHQKSDFTLKILTKPTKTEGRRKYRSPNTNLTTKHQGHK